VKTEGKKRNVVSVKLTDSEFEQLEYIAQKEYRTRSNVIVHLILSEYARLFQDIDEGKHL
jgi:metal-responsive CopG/Arc/MetJ family transcriptional regulator